METTVIVELVEWIVIGGVALAFLDKLFGWMKKD